MIPSQFERVSEDDGRDIEDEEDDELDGDPATEEETLVAKLLQWEKDARRHYSRWRQEARDCYNFVAGDQWTADDKASLLDQMRQPIVFNRVGPMVDAVLGAEILNRQEVKYSPREIGDAQTAEVITGASDWVRDLSDAEDEESDAFADTVVCGMGWTETRMDYEIDPEGRVVIDRVDPFEMWADKDCKKRNLADARYVIRGRWRNRDELPKEWRRKVYSAGDDGTAVDDFGRGESGPGDDYDRGEPDTASAGEGSRKRIWIRHFQWWELEDAYKLADPETSKIAVMSPDEYKQTVMMFLQAMLRPPEAVKIKRRTYWQAFIAGGALLEPKSRIPCNDFTFKCITGKRDRNAGTWYGIVRAMMDPQMWANKWLSQILHILNSSAKGGVLYEEGAFVNDNEAREEWAKPDGMIKLKSGAIQRNAVQERKAQNYPAGLDKLLEFAIGSMPQVTGINLELLGLVQKEQAGVLEAQRKQAGYAILAVFFDSLRRYRKMQGRVMLHYIQNYLSDGRLVRIMGQNGLEQYVPLVKDPALITYDVVVDEAPMSANQKESVWAMMMQLMPTLQKSPAAPQLMAKFLQYSPLPSSVSMEVGQMLTQASQPDPQAQQAQMAAAEMEARKANASAAKDESTAALNMAKAQREQAATPLPAMPMPLPGPAMPMMDEPMMDGMGAAPPPGVPPEMPMGPMQ